MPKTTRGWPEKRRKAQAEKIRQTRPWGKSTGPRSQEGKSRSSRNGITHGMSGEAGQKLKAALRQQRKLIAIMEALSSAADIFPPPAQREGGSRGEGRCQDS